MDDHVRERIIVCQIAAELIFELSQTTPDDFIQLKLLTLSAARSDKVKAFLQKVFLLAAERRPLLIEMK